MSKKTTIRRNEIAILSYLPKYISFILFAMMLQVSNLHCQATSSPLSDYEVGKRLAMAYPAFIAGPEGPNLIWRDGMRTPLSDGNRRKTFKERLSNADLTDMFSQAYRAGRLVADPAKDEDPGRFRNESFFTHVYGDCQTGGVLPHLRPVQWMPHRGGRAVLMTTVNGVADHLEAAVRELEELPAAMTDFLVPSSGTYTCRAIAGTSQRSMHAYGAAIDINAARADYWRWPLVHVGPVNYRNHVPFEIVEIFEKHGFIWGGKWYHFDTMHFEYRPELLESS